MKKQYFVLSHDTARNNAVMACRNAPYGYVVEIKEKTRSLEQNSMLWALLTDVSGQVDWYGRKLSPENWKNVFSAALKKQDVVPNIDGDGFVVLGQSTSKMGKKEFGDMIELIQSFGAQRGVVWSDDHVQE
jgi:hypothetical protein